MLGGLTARCFFFFVGLALFRWSRSAELTEWPELGGRSLVAHGDTPLSPIALKWPGVDPGQHSFSSSSLSFRLFFQQSSTRIHFERTAAGTFLFNRCSRGFRYTLHILPLV